MKQEVSLFLRQLSRMNADIFVIKSPIVCALTPWVQAPIRGGGGGKG
jgi:hypothetical protein